MVQYWTKAAEKKKKETNKKWATLGFALILLSSILVSLGFIIWPLTIETVNSFQGSSCSWWLAPPIVYPRETRTRPTRNNVLAPLFVILLTEPCLYIASNHCLALDVLIGFLSFLDWTFCDVSLCFVVHMEVSHCAILSTPNKESRSPAESNTNWTHFATIFFLSAQKCIPTPTPPCLNFCSFYFMTSNFLFFCSFYLLFPHVMTFYLERNISLYLSCVVKTILFGIYLTPCNFVVWQPLPNDPWCSRECVEAAGFLAAFRGPNDQWNTGRCSARTKETNFSVTEWKKKKAILNNKGENFSLKSTPYFSG